MTTRSEAEATVRAWLDAHGLTLEDLDLPHESVSDCTNDELMVLLCDAEEDRDRALCSGRKPTW